MSYKKGKNSKEDLIKWCLDHVGKIAILLTIMVLVIPILIHIMFKVPAINDFMIAKWNAGDMLSYYGSVLSFLGTIILGFIALYQNDKAEKENEKHEKFIEKLESIKNSPLFHIYKSSSSYRFENVTFYICNRSETNIAKEISISNLTVTDNDNGSIILSSDSQSIKNNFLQVGSSTEIQFINKPINKDNVILSYCIYCKDKAGVLHKFIVVSNVKEVSNPNIEVNVSEVDIEYK
jgi:uncharacterized membrane protein